MNRRRFFGLLAALAAGFEGAVLKFSRAKAEKRSRFGDIDPNWQAPEYFGTILPRMANPPQITAEEFNAWMAEFMSGPHVYGSRR